jgi:hypothetical protein
LFVGPVTLHATPATGPFQGWFVGNTITGPMSPIPCSTDPTCVIPSDIPGQTDYISGDFGDSSSVPLTLVVTGSGSIRFGASSRYLTCSSTCTTNVVPGVTYQLTASSTDVFAGWSEASCGTSLSCNVTLQNAATVQASFTKHDREDTNLAPSVPTDVVAWAPDGDLIVAGGNIVSKLSPDGVIRWSTVLDDVSRVTSPLNVAVGSDGTVFYVFDANLGISRQIGIRALSPLGQPRWSRILHGWEASLGYYGANDRVVQPTPDGGVAIALSVDVDVFGDATLPMLVTLDANGNDAWSVVLPGTPDALARGPAGYFVDTQDADGIRQIARYGFDGTPFGTFVTTSPWFGHVAIAADSAGGVAIVASTFDDVTFSYLGADGTMLFENIITVDNHDDVDIPVFVSLDQYGNMIGAFDYPFGPVHVEQRSPVGALLWSVDSTGFVQQLEVAGDGGNRLAFAGRTYQQPWLQTFTMP